MERIIATRKNGDDEAPTGRGSPGRRRVSVRAGEPGESYVAALRRWPVEIARITNKDLAAKIGLLDARVSEVLHNHRNWRATKIVLERALKIIEACGGGPEDLDNWRKYHYEVVEYQETTPKPTLPMPPEPVRFTTTPVPAPRSGDLFEPHRELGGLYLPSALLRADYGVVPFEHRHNDLARLVAWANRVDPVSSLLITAAGGQGKTRLAIRLCEVLRAQGWSAGFLKHDLSQGLLEPSLLEPRTLLVIDYAEGRTPQVVDAIEAMCGLEQGRVLLLSRSAGEWRAGLGDTDDEMAAAVLASMTETALSPLVVTGDRSTEFSRAVREFAHRLKVPASTVPIPDDLDDSRYETALDIHAAALVGVLDQVEPDARGPAWTDPVKRVLRHEKKYWDRTIGPYALVDPYRGRLHQVVAAGTLFGAPDHATALRVVGALSTFVDQPLDVVERFVRWSVDVYGGDGVLGGMRPDRLGEDHVVETLEHCPDLVTAGAAVADPDQVRNALTVLGRAAPRRDEAGRAVDRLLRGDVERLIPLAVDVVPRLADSRVITATMTSVVRQATSAPFIRRLADLVPLGTIALAEFGAMVNRQALAAVPDDGSREQAKLLSALGNRLLQLDEVEEAQVHLTAAADMYRSFAGNGERHAVADLARALCDVADALYVMGHFEDAAERTGEAADLLRPLAAEHWPDHGATLVEVLVDHAANLVALNRDAEALVVLDETMGDAERSGRDVLAHALHHRGAALGELGRLREACGVTEHAVELYRRLADEEPDRYADSYAEVMSDLTGFLYDLRRSDEALAASEQVIMAVRRLVETYGRRFNHTLANVLNNRGIVLADQDMHEEAEDALREAAELFGSLDTANSHAYQADIARTRSNRAISLRALGRLDEALAEDTESTGFFRKLAGPSPADPSPELIEALLGLYLDHSELDQRDEAHQVIEEAVALSRELILINPELGEPKLATALGNLAESWHARDDDVRATAPAEESLRLHRALARDLPARYQDGVAHMAQLLGVLHSLRGRHRKAVHAHAEAIGAYRRLKSTANRPHLADIYREMSTNYLNLGDKRGGWRRALRAAEIAANLYRELIAEGGDYEDVLVDALYGQACAYIDHHARLDALEVLDEAVEIARGGHVDEETLNLVTETRDAVREHHVTDVSPDAETLAPVIPLWRSDSPEIELRRRTVSPEEARLVTTLRDQLNKVVLTGQDWRLIVPGTQQLRVILDQLTQDPEKFPAVLPDAALQLCSYLGQTLERSFTMSDDVDRAYLLRHAENLRQQILSQLPIPD